MLTRIQHCACFVFTFAVLVCLLLTTTSRAQIVGATISGTVADPSGSVIPDAQIAITNTDTGGLTTIKSNAQGFYTAPNLQPGNYDIRTTANGFATTETRMKLEVGGQQLVNIALQPGSVTQSVEVKDTPPSIELATSQISDVVDAQTMRELPLNGRDWTQLATLQPGVAAVRTEKAVAVGADRGNRGYGVQITIAGARPQQNNYRLDGISINDYSNGAPGSVVGLNLGVDAIQEFSVVTSNYSAEYGRTSGGVINAISRAGTNQFHGSVYEFFRNSALDARNFFDGATIPPFKRNQFGASAGGPIVKDRTFIFGDYEGLRQSLGFTQVDQVPSAAGIATASPAIQPYLVLYPQPNGPVNGLTGQYKFAGQQVTPEDFFTVRADHKVSDKDALHGSYMFDNGTFTQPDSLNDIFLKSHTRRQSGSAETTHTFTPTFINTVRFGVSRVAADINGSAAGPVAAGNDPKLGVVPGQNAPSFITPGLTTFGGGVDGPSAYHYGWTSLQAYDDAFVTKGVHSLKFGFAFERMRNNILALSNPSGLFRFNSVATFLAGQPNEFDASIPGTTSPRNMRQNLVGGYVQDDIHFRPYLTFNVGLRYEMSTVPTEVNGKLSTLRNLTDAQPHLGDPYFSNPTTRNFEPRVGFAWDPFHTGTTSVRGAFGIFDSLPLPYQFELLSSLAAPFLELGSATALPAGVFPNAAFPLISASPSALRQTYIDPNPKRNYVMQWNLHVERQVARDLTVTAGYVGTRGIHQAFRSDDVNTVLPTVTPQGLTWPSPHNSGTKLNPNAGQIAALFWTGHSYYNGLQLQVVKRMSHGFQSQSSFTYSKAIDDGSASLAGDPFGNSISGLFYFNEQSRRGPADFNIGKNFVQNLIWTMPAAKSLHGPVGWAANGWEMGGIFQASDGLPFTPLIGGDVLGLKNTAPYDVPNRVSGCSPTSLQYNAPVQGQVQYINLSCFTAPSSFNVLGNAGRNSLTGPGLADLDFSVFKNNKIPRISENFNVQFRAEFFNILNFTNFAPPSSGKTLLAAAFAPGGATATFSPVTGAGLVTSTQTSSRQIQLALKVSW
ncbi:MAG TPA: carboxypeptidase regulatory-like domain-containing protein [Terriglobales bacterium]|nr:carboxypeptidase regulatory-like domain-containing protein [Terriglobales bacterium]